MVSDYGAVAFPRMMHQVAATEGEAAALALTAGPRLPAPAGRDLSGDGVS